MTDAQIRKLVNKTKAVVAKRLAVPVAVFHRSCRTCTFALFCACAGDYAEAEKRGLLLIYGDCVAHYTGVLAKAVKL